MFPFACSCTSVATIAQDLEFLDAVESNFGIKMSSTLKAEAHEVVLLGSKTKIEGLFLRHIKEKGKDKVALKQAFSSLLKSMEGGSIKLSDLPKNLAERVTKGMRLA